MIEFCNEIKKMRINKNMTQEDLASKLGCSKAAISAMEHNRSPMQHRETILAYCRALGMDEKKWMKYYNDTVLENDKYKTKNKEDEKFNPNPDSIYYLGKEIELNRLNTEEICIINVILAKYL